MELIKFETANLAEENGFPFKFVIIKNEKIPTNIPTQSQLHNWLIDKYGLYVLVNHNGNITFNVSISRIRQMNPNKRHICEIAFINGQLNNTYTEIFEKGLFVALKLIK